VCTRSFASILLIGLKLNDMQCVCIDAGHLLANVSWTCQQSNDDVEITGYHILVNGKQYGSLLHEGVDCLRIKVCRNLTTTFQ